MRRQAISRDDLERVWRGSKQIQNEFGQSRSDKPGRFGTPGLKMPADPISWAGSLLRAAFSGRNDSEIGAEPSGRADVPSYRSLAWGKSLKNG